jgi:hypothetical protein
MRRHKLGASANLSTRNTQMSRLSRPTRTGEEDGEIANLPLAFAEVLAGAIILDAGIKGDSIANVVKGQATQHPLGSSSGSTTAGTGSSSGSGSSSGYVNPFPGAKASRVDQGVDYTGTQFLAPGNSRILQADQSNPGWKGGGYIAAQLIDGPLAGTVYYVAEGIAPLVQAGQTVAAGTPLGRPVTNPYNGILGNIEAGWANPASPGQPLAQATGGYAEGASTAAGASFNRFVQALGGPLGQLASTILGHLAAGLP